MLQMKMSLWLIKITGVGIQLNAYQPIDGEDMNFDACLSNQNTFVIFYIYHFSGIYSTAT